MENLLNTWRQYAKDYEVLAKMGESAPEHHSHLHEIAKIQRARAETFNSCAKELEIALENIDSTNNDIKDILQTM